MSAHSERKPRFRAFIAGSFMTALAVTSVAPVLLGAGTALVGVELVASLIGGAIAASQI